MAAPGNSGKPGYVSSGRGYSSLPFCTNCGNQVGDRDCFCRRCGKPQPGAAGASSASSAAGGLSPNGASILCYIPWFGWIAAVYVLMAERFRGNRTTRFHAYQGLYLFVGWMLVHWVIGIWLKLIFGHRFPFEGLFELGMLGLWIFMLVKTSTGERFSLPIVGELAERSL